MRCAVASVSERAPGVQPEKIQQDAFTMGSSFDNEERTSSRGPRLAAADPGTGGHH